MSGETAPLALHAFGSVDMAELRTQMVRFAALQLGDHGQAEDAVQEALIGALRNSRGFAGRAALRSWVFAILKHKIADILRQNFRHGTAAPAATATDANVDAMFTRRGQWNADARPSDWGDPQQAMESEQFWQVLELCMTRLPEPQARVFLMREFVELDWQEICGATGVTHGHLNVLLYRARMRLRACLEAGWLTGEDCPC